MTRFRPALRRAARELDLPRTVRAAILLELAGDLEVAYEDLRRRGFGEEEAEHRAEALILGSGEMVRRLERIHSGAWDHWSREIGERLTSPGGLVLIVVAVLPVLVVAAAQAAVWELALGILWLGGSTAVRIQSGRVRGDEAGRGLQAILFWGSMALVLGLLGTVVGVVTMAQSIASAGTAPQGLVWGGFGVALSTFIFGLLIFIVSAILWFALDQWRKRAGGRMESLAAG